MVTREQIASGLVAFLTNEVLPKITDKPLRIAVDTLQALLRLRPELIDKVIDNPLFKTAKGYDIDTMGKALKDSLAKNGPLTLTIPSVPFVSPVEKDLTFNGDDIDALCKYIKGGNA